MQIVFLLYLLSDLEGVVTLLAMFLNQEPNLYSQGGQAFTLSGFDHWPIVPAFCVSLCGHVGEDSVKKQHGFDARSKDISPNVAMWDL